MRGPADVAPSGRGYVHQALGGASVKERERGSRGLQEHLLPLIEDAISERFSPRPLPPELMRVLRMMEANCSR